MAYMGSIKLDIKNRKILEQLEFNTRQSNRQLAKKVGVSKDAVAYRIAKLEEEKIIEGYYAVLNIAKLGLIQFKIFISLQNTDSEIEKEIIEYLKNDENVGWVVSCDGYYNLMAVAWVRNPIDFDKFFIKFLNKYSKYCKQREVVVIPEEYALRNSYLFDKKTDFEISYYGGEPELNLDKKDLIITEMLANNSKESLINISDKVKLTPEGIKNRIKNLKEQQILLAFRPKLNTNLLGYSFYNLLFKLKKTNNLEKIYDYFKKNANVVYISKYLGAYDLGVDVRVKDSEELRGILSKFKDAFKEDIESYISILIYHEHKLSYFPHKLLLQ
jgi:Lrp/AsnC family leucine-responsive transcriptional regulator